MVTGPENTVSQVERRHSDVAPVLGGRVCFVIGDEDGNEFDGYEGKIRPFLDDTLEYVSE